MKRAISLALTVAILALLFWKVDRAALLANLRATRWTWFSLAIFMFVPQIWAIAWRWRRMVGVFTPISWGEAVGLILASNTMNLILPSKLGDLTKGYFLARTGALDLKRAMNVVVFEKMLDVATLALVMLGGVSVLFASGAAMPVQRGAAVVAGLAGLAAVSAVAILYFIPPSALPGFHRLLTWLNARPRFRKIHSLLEASHETISLLQSRGARRGLICALSLLIWFFHLVQIYFFFLSLNAQPLPVFQFATLVPLAIFIGLVPLTVAGFGTRDGALISFFPQFPPSLMLGVALYVNLRYIVPAIAGLPYLNRYLTAARALRAGSPGESDSK
ncbi:MAG: flippase-like domain-containing protein [Candidatus Sumerlaea chitinivorans]|nr:flippase-like domain-containing protein [Candidatus Sumerlaea chitinivorans]